MVTSTIDALARAEVRCFLRKHKVARAYRDEMADVVDRATASGEWITLEQALPLAIVLALKRRKRRTSRRTS